MTYAHMKFAKMRRMLEQGEGRTDRYYRIWNEVPTLLMIIIIIMAVVEPF